MKKYKLYPIAFIIIISTTCFCILNTNKSFTTLELSMADGEEYVIAENIDLFFTPYYFDFENDTYNDLIKKSTLFDVRTLSFQNSVVIRSFETETNNANDFVSYVNRIAIGRGLGYTNILNKGDLNYEGREESLITDFLYATGYPDQVSYNWDKTGNFHTYYHQILQSKTARNILFDEALNIVKNVCKNVPNDFRRRVVNELDALLEYSKTLPNTSYTEKKVFADYWKGFLYRRYFIDKVPLSEIQSQIAYAKKELSELILEHEFACELKINKDLVIFLSLGNFKVKSNLNQKEIPFKNKQLVKIKHLADKISSYYQLMLLDSNGDEIRLLYDAKLNQIE